MTALTTVPDGIDVVGTAAEAAALTRPPLLVVEPLKRFLAESGVGDAPLSWRRIGDGQANITVELRTGDSRLVLRRGPRPPFPPSAHDMLREARIITAVGARGVPVPRVLAVCADESVLGVPFYLMSFLDGEVITDRLPPGFDGPGGTATVHAAVDALARLHGIPLDGDIAALGRPEGYLRRQVSRFAQLWPLNTRRSVPAIDALGQELAATMPTVSGAGIVHGDYRLGNIMFVAPGQVGALLDWEMATLGDPLRGSRLLRRDLQPAGGRTHTDGPDARHRAGRLSPTGGARRTLRAHDGR